MKRPPSPRMRRVNSILRQVIAEQVEGLKDPRMGFVTITAVETSPDLRHAVVFYSVLGDEDDQRATLAALRAGAPRIQGEMGRQVRLKYTPRLEFRLDASIERGARITTLLREIAEHEGPGEERADGDA